MILSQPISGSVGGGLGGVSGASASGGAGASGAGSTEGGAGIVSSLQAETPASVAAATGVELAGDAKAIADGVGEFIRDGAEGSGRFTTTLANGAMNSVGIIPEIAAAKIAAISRIPGYFTNNNGGSLGVPVGFGVGGNGAGVGSRNGVAEGLIYPNIDWQTVPRFIIDGADGGTGTVSRAFLQPVARVADSASASMGGPEMFTPAWQMGEGSRENAFQWGRNMFGGRNPSSGVNAAMGGETNGNGGLSLGVGGSVQA